MRMVFQIVSGRQVWRGHGINREYLLAKLREFHRVHATPLDVTIRDMNQALNWLSKTAYAEEAQRLIVTNDQPGVARRLESLGAASVVVPSRDSADRIRQELTMILNDGKFRQAAARCRDMLADAPKVEFSADLISRALTERRRIHRTDLARGSG